MNIQTKLRLAAAFTLALTPAPLLADLVQFNADIPGLGTVALTIDTSTAQPQPQASQRPAQAVGFAVRLLQDWSRPGVDGAFEVARHYAPSVWFYGSQRSASSIADERYSMAVRWSVRDYRIDPETVDVFCDAACYVSAEYDFTASNPVTGEWSAGRSTLDLVLRPVGAGFAIVEENGIVFARH